MVWLTCALATALLAQAEAPSQAPAKTARWDAFWRLRTEFALDDNVFQLDPDAMDRLDEERPSDTASGRYAEMENNADVVFAPSARLEAKGPSPFGGKLDLTLDLEYRHYFRNPARTYATAEVAIEQPVGRDGRLGIEIEILPVYFNKNYLADAIDFTGNVSASERIYEPGNYLEWRIDLDYRHRMAQDEALSLDGVVALGWRDRAYDDPFSGRDESGLSLAAELRFAFGKAVRAALRCTHENVACPVEDEILLLDETSFGAVLNGDGDATDTSARSLQAVDRSRLERTLGLSLEVRLAAEADLEISVGRGWKDFSSGKPYDLDHRGRKDTRDKFGAELRIKLGRGWEARAGFETTGQETDRPEDPDAAGETLDYRRRVVFIGVSVRG